LSPILSNAAIFGSDLVSIGLGARIQEMFDRMIAGPGAVRATMDACLLKAE
jgi:fructuronate reductase